MRGRVKVEVRNDGRENVMAESVDTECSEATAMTTFCRYHPPRWLVEGFLGLCILLIIATLCFGVYLNEVANVLQFDN